MTNNGDNVLIKTPGKESRSLLSAQKAPGTVVDTWGVDDGSGRQRWSLVPVVVGTFVIKSAEPGREGYLCVVGQAVTIGPRAQAAEWRTVDAGGGLVSFKLVQAAEFPFLSVHCDGWDDVVCMWREVGSNRERWSISVIPSVTTQVPPEAVARLSAFGVSEAQVDAIQSLVACPENSTTNWPRAYGFAKALQDGRGVTFGLLGFCSGTGDGVLVLDATARRDPSHRLARFIPAMRRTRGEDRTGLGGFEDAVRASANDAAFREAQWEIGVSMYWLFSRDFCRKENSCASRPGPVLKTALGLGAIFDTAINHGANYSSFKHVINLMSQPSTANEGAWIKSFMDARFQLLRSGFQDLDTSGTGARARIWQKLVDESNWDLRRPIDVYSGPGAYWGKQRVV